LAGTSVDITGDLVIGREDADLTLDDSQVSRRHAIVRHVGAGLEIEDLDSSNGTFVDGTRITKATLLTDGAKLRVGVTELVAEGIVGATRVSPEGAPDATKVGRPPDLAAVPTTKVGGVPTTRVGPDPRAQLDPEMIRAHATETEPPPAVPSEEGVPERPSGGPPRRPGGPPAPGGRPPGRPPLRMLLRSRGARVAVALVVVGVAAAIAILASSGGSSAKAMVDVPVQFTVHDIDRSPLKCRPTGATYQVQGRLIEPGSGGRSAVTLYLSGVIFSGEFEFHNQVSGYNWARAMAAQGQSSLVIDRVGYGRTVPYPADGRSVCLGTQADMVHQIIGDLRDGRFTVRGSSGVHASSFPHVALAGYSIGGVIAELEAASFKDVDALILLSWADQGFSTYGTSFSYTFAHCMPGQPKAPGGKLGYFPTLPVAKIPHLLSPEASPAIVASLPGAEELDPCGQELTGGQWFAGLANAARASITVPVLIAYGDYDALFNPSAWPVQFAKFTGTRDRTLVGIPDGQMLMLDRHVPLTRHVVASWLALHGL
jgi:pimeloyl-ACP methyl ester carboxylesterase